MTGKATVLEQQSPSIVTGGEVPAVAERNGGKPTDLSCASQVARPEDKGFDLRTAFAVNPNGNPGISGTSFRFQRVFVDHPVIIGSDDPNMFVRRTEIRVPTTSSRIFDDPNYPLRCGMSILRVLHLLKREASGAYDEGMLNRCGMSQNAFLVRHMMNVEGLFLVLVSQSDSPAGRRCTRRRGGSWNFDVVTPIDCRAMDVGTPIFHLTSITANRDMLRPHDVVR